MATKTKKITVSIFVKKAGLECEGLLGCDECEMTFTVDHDGEELHIGTISDVNVDGERIKGWVFARVHDEVVEYIVERLDEEFLSRLQHDVHVSLPGRRLVPTGSNENILDGVVCPVCGNEGLFVALVTTWADLTDDGIDPYGEEAGKEMSGIEYENTLMKCCSCEHQGRKWEFEGGKEPYEVMLSYDLFDAMRIGKDEVYERAEEVIGLTYGVDIDVGEMKMTPVGIQDEEVLYRCVPVAYRIGE